MGILLDFIKEIFTYLCFQEVLKKSGGGERTKEAKMLMTAIGT